VEWSDFILGEFDYCRFPPGSRVLDVGCGAGEQLEALRRAGLGAAGVEPSQELVDRLVARGFDARRGVAEHLPVDDSSFDGLICKVVLPYTDERRAIAEWARVLRPNATVWASYHGAGYYLRYLREGTGLAERLYAMRSLANGWWYAATGRRLPGFVGDTLYQSARRLDRYYRDSGFALQRAWPSPGYGGKPAFIYHELRRLTR
jgi:SAM-dependent methyltransferase